MKKLILICYLASLSFPSMAQTFDEWWKQKDTQIKYLTEQITALGVYSSVLKEGYETVSKGLGLVQAIQNGDHLQHLGYFNSLSTVNPQIKNHSDAQKALSLYSQTMLLTQQIPNQLFPSPYFSESEEKVIRHVLLEIQKDCDHIPSELDLLLTDGGLQLNDTARAKALTALNQRMQEVYSYTIRFYQECQNLSLLRQHETEEITKSQSLHPINSN